jgi:hypothetical protein
MAIVRYKPGGLVLEDGRYVPVGHYGEFTDVVAWCRQGERFPPVLGSGDLIAPVWFVRLLAEEEIRASIAA